MWSGRLTPQLCMFNLSKECMMIPEKPSINNEQMEFLNLSKAE